MMKSIGRCLPPATLLAWLVIMGCLCLAGLHHPTSATEAMATAASFSETDPVINSTEAATPQLGYFEAIVLGVVEGITEFLPVSSTGHLILTNRLLGLHGDADLAAAADAYIVIIQVGAIAAVIVIYWSTLLRLLAGLLGRDPGGRRLLGLLMTAFAPAAVLGLSVGDWIEDQLFHPQVVALGLAVGAFLMLAVEFWRRRKLARELSGDEAEEPPELNLEELTHRQALLIGFMQCLALWPGMSRAMVTLVGGYLAGLSPRRAAEFSFLLGLITLSAASGYVAVKDGQTLLQVAEIGPMLVGLVVATVSAFLAVKWLIGFLTRHGLAPFAWYRLLLAVAVFVWLG